MLAVGQQACKWVVVDRAGTLGAAVPVGAAVDGGCTEQPEYRKPCRAVWWCWCSATASLPGWALPRGRFPSLLAAATGGGSQCRVSVTPPGGQERLPPLLDKWQPDLVIVELGGNDFLRQTPATRVGLPARHRTHGGPPARGRAGGRAPPVPAAGQCGGRWRIRRYALKVPGRKMLLVPDVLADILSQAHLQADRIHPNAAGYRQLAAGLGSSGCQQPCWATRRRGYPLSAAAPSWICDKEIASVVAGIYQVQPGTVRSMQASLPVSILRSPDESDYHDTKGKNMMKS